MPVQSISSNQFVTTSSILKHLNAQIPRGEFELHTRLPDGSSRSATDAEQTAADFQAKVQQAVVHVQSLATEEERIDWANEQNALGNKLFQEERKFAEAVDIYLTCLTVTAELKSSDHALLFVKVMNNLASCTLQLKWFRKTMDFCTMALDQISKTEDYLADESLRLYIAKLHFKRSKAGRLRGDYCVLDLRRAQELTVEAPEELKTAVEKERRLLEKAMVQADAAEKAQQTALRKQFAGGTTTRQLPSTIERKVEQPSLYEESIPRARQFSTIRAPSQMTEVDEIDERPSYLETYWTRVLKVSRSLFAVKED